MTDLTALIDRLTPQARAALLQRLGGPDAGASATRESRETAEPIALIGIGCRYPGDVASPVDFWQLVTEGRDAIGPFPAERWGATPITGLPAQDPQSANPIRSGGFIRDAEGFDAAFFGISPSEATGMDPQQRVLLEVAWEALEHAGVAPRGLSGSRTGVYAGIAAPDYLVERLHDPTTRGDLHTISGAIHSTAVGRVSYLLDLRGPAVAVDTACSSSLVAVHLACQALRSGDTDLALAGGVHVISSVLTSFGLSSSGLAGQDGRCKTFDAAADGIARAEGCGVVVLKRLADAERDGDRVLAVIRGSAVNQDGRSTSLTAPSVQAQKDVLAAALRRAGVRAEQVGLVETHGTGTVLGDPIEVEALAAVYGPGGRGSCALGAVKTNIGHSEEAAGVAGLIKAVLALNAGIVPPNLHFRTLNPNIDLDGTRLVVPQRAMDWPVPGEQRYAAVSAFGMGGTNAHVVLSTPPSARRPVVGPDTPALLPLSAGSPGALRAGARRLADWLEGPGRAVPLVDVAYTLARRSALDERLVAVVPEAPAELPALLRGFADGETLTGLASGSVLPAARAGSVWVFPGQGGQWAGMGRELLAAEAEFAKTVDEIDPLVREAAGFSVRELLAEGADPDTSLALCQPLIFTVQVALARTWMAHGHRPAAVLGHSMGEVAAAVVAGGLSLADAVRVICLRSDLGANRLAGQGMMALVELSAEETEARLAGADDVSVAVLSGPQATVVSGAAATVARLVEQWSAEGLLTRQIKGVTFASHSPQVDSLLPELRERLADLRPQAPDVRFYSTAAVAGPRAQVVFDGDYWADNLRNPVRFADAVTAAVEDGHQLFVEISPHPITEPQITATATAVGSPEVVVIPSIRRHAPERATLLAHLGLAHAHGLPVVLPLPPTGCLADVPTTAWEHRRYWLRETAAQPAPRADLHPLLGVHLAVPGTVTRHLWQAELNPATLPWLADHRVNDLPVLPGTAYCELALAAAVEAFGVPAQRIALSDIDYQALLLLADPVTVTVSLRPDGAEGAVVEILSPGPGPEGRTVHATARARLLPAGDPAPSVTRDLAALIAEHPDRRSDPEELYRRMRASGQYHGPAFRGTAELLLAAPDADGARSVMSRLARPEEATANPMLHTHPALLDGWFHLIAAAVLDRPESYLPAGLGTLRLYGSPDRAAYARARLSVADGGAGLLADVELLDSEGRVVIEAGSILLREVAPADLPTTNRGKLFRLDWEPAQPPGGAGRTGTVLLLGEAGETAAARLALEGAGRPCLVAEPGGLPELEPGTTDVVMLLTAPGTGADPVAEAESRVLLVVRTAADLAAARLAPGSERPRLRLVTRGARVLGAGEVPDLAQGALRGIARSLVLELPELRTTLVDLDPAASDFADLAVELATAPDQDDEIAWRGGTRHLARLRRIDTAPGTPEHPVVRPGGGYVVTGGLSGVGRHTAGWLAAQGAGCVVLNARSEPDAQTLAEIERIRALGTDVRVVRGDISEEGTAERLVAEVASAGAPLLGVVHSAVALDDCVLANLDAHRLATVWRPKALGAWRLHRATEGTELDWWVGYSSIASFIGAAGQANYAAANAFLDTLAEWRAATGRPALSVNWGGWAEIGRARDLSHEAFPMMRPAEGMSALAELIGRGLPGAAAMRVEPSALVRTMPETARSSFFAPLVAEAGQTESADGWSGARALRALPPERLREAVADRLRERVAGILGHRASDLSRRQPLTRLGLDSLMAVKTKNAVLADFGVTLAVARLLQGASLGDMTEQIVGELGSGSGAAEPSAPSGAMAQAQERARARRTARTNPRRNR
ncbi:type I polyketide synthase [Kitasatospora sp. NPDC005856]|uniref:type I polyketide synthase n=1 Tax=Kitasatospora sp. NPDC005856 TaxID=3154566 RepID=UPI0033E810AD